MIKKKNPAHRAAWKIQGHLFNTYLSSAYYVPDIILGSMTSPRPSPYLCEAYIIGMFKLSVRKTRKAGWLEHQWTCWGSGRARAGRGCRLQERGRECGYYLRAVTSCWKAISKEKSAVICLLAAVCRKKCGGRAERNRGASGKHSSTSNRKEELGLDGRGRKHSGRASLKTQSK